MQKSEAINELATALSKAQADIKGAKKDSENPFFKSQYSDLSSVWEAVRAPLTKNGLAIIQAMDTVDFVVTLETMMTHSSGQWISSKLSMTPDKNTPQAIGSVISYMRRYALAAITSCPSIDDDAESAMARPESSPVQYSKPTPVKKTLKDDFKSETNHVHHWELSKYNSNQEYCFGCKGKREITSKT